VFFTITCAGLAGHFGGMTLAFARALANLRGPSWWPATFPGRLHPFPFIFQHVQLGQDAQAYRLLGVSWRWPSCRLDQ